MLVLSDAAYNILERKIFKVENLNRVWLYIKIYKSKLLAFSLYLIVAFYMQYLFSLLNSLKLWLKKIQWKSIHKQNF